MDVKKYETSGWTRQLTPPDSPLPSLRTVLEFCNQGGSSKRMSLDFIAPGCRLPQTSTSSSAIRSSSTRSSPSAASELAPVRRVEVSILNKGEPCSNTPASKSAYTRSHNGHNPISGLPSPVWSSCSDMSLPQPSTFQQMQKSDNHYRQHDQCQLLQPRSRSPGYTYTPPPQPSLSKPTRLNRRPGTSRSQSPPRPDRYTYDSEEIYAIIHLRAVLGLKWKDVLKEFSRLFPVGQQRRCKINSAPGLPPTYHARDVQGLQCRWYRLRDEENLRPLRRGKMVEETVGDVEAQVLERMAREGWCGEEFLRKLR
jgi:hypothetical protein